MNRHAWEFALLHEARSALCSGDLTVEGSQRYAPWDSDLYTPEDWARRRTTWYAENGLPEDGATYLKALLADLHEKILKVARRLPRNQDARIEGDKLVLTALEKVELPQEALSARAILVSLFPLTGLPELLMEVDHNAHERMSPDTRLPAWPEGAQALGCAWIFLTTRKTGNAAATFSNSASGASLSTGIWGRAPGARCR